MGDDQAIATPLIGPSGARHPIGKTTISSMNARDSGQSGGRAIQLPGPNRKR